jgi:hypothetical protein
MHVPDAAVDPAAQPASLLLAEQQISTQPSASRADQVSPAATTRTSPPLPVIVKAPKLDSAGVRRLTIGDTSLSRLGHYRFSTLG